MENAVQKAPCWYSSWLKVSLLALANGISLVCNYMEKKHTWIRVSEPEDTVLDFFLLFWLCTAGFR